jgi:hypothetical protein
MLFSKRQNAFLKAKKPLFSKRHNPFFSKRTKPLLLKRTKPFFLKRTIRLFQGPPAPIFPCVVVAVVGISRESRIPASTLCCIVVGVSRKIVFFFFASLHQRCDRIVVVVAAVAPNRPGQYRHSIVGS